MSHVLATGLGHPEGPDVLDDGSIIFVETYTGKVRRVSEAGEMSDIAATGGGPNACLCGDDGRVYVTQSGGTVGAWSAGDGVPGGIQAIDAAGRVHMLTQSVGGQRLNAPNDLAFAPDGSLVFTDSGRFDPLNTPDEGYIFRLDTDGGGRALVATGRTYPNGVVVEDDGSVVWVETYSRALRRLRADHRAAETIAILPEGHFPDGLKIDQNGNFWITVTGAGGLDVVTPRGDYLKFFETGGVPLNCCFAGSELIVTDFGTTDTTTGKAVMLGKLMRFDAGVRGQTVARGRIAAGVHA